MNGIYGQESETEGIRRIESQQDIWVDAYSGGNAERTGKGTGNQRLAPDRENRTERIVVANAIGGILDQLIDDAEKQLVKSRECIVWYKSEAKEYEEKLNSLRKLKELQQKQIAAAESSNNEGENLPE